MAHAVEKTENLKSFDPYTDQNGQAADLDANEVGRADELGHVLRSKPDGESETARLASGQKSEDATADTEAETPAENIDHISNPHIAGAETPIERATAALGTDE